MKRFIALFFTLAAIATAQVVIPWTDIGSKPTTLSGYGITEASCPILPGGTYLGYQAGAAAPGNGTYNTLIGYQAGALLNPGYNNTLVGFQSGSEATSAFANSALGLQALQHVTTGSFNSAIGIHALLSLQGGIANNAVGAGAMEYLVNGGSNNALGMYAGRDAQGSGNLFLGHQAGMTYTGSNALFVANSSTNTLIYGDFSTKRIGLAGTTTPQAELDIDGTYTAIRLKLNSATDAWMQLRGTPDGIGFEHARVFLGRDATETSYGSYLAFYTEAKGSGATDTSTEKARITGRGNFLVGTAEEISGSGGASISGSVKIGTGSISQSGVALSIANNVTGANLSLDNARDDSVITPTNDNAGYASWDSSAQIRGTTTANHFVAFQSGGGLNAVSGALQFQYGFWDISSVFAGTVANRISFAATNKAGTGTVQRQYGLKVENLTSGTVENWAIFTGLGKVWLGDDVTINASLALNGDFLGKAGGTTFTLPGDGDVFKFDRAIELTRDVFLYATKRLYLDGGSNTYLHESSADTVQVVTGGTAAATISASGATFAGQVISSGNGVDGVFGFKSGTAYPLTMQGYVDAYADATIWHNAYTTYAGGVMVLKGGTTSSAGVRGIRFGDTRAGISGIMFFASADTVTANADYTPTERARITNTGNLLVGTTADMTGSGGLKVAGVTTLGTVGEYVDNAAALAAGLAVGTLYRTGDVVKIVH